MKRKRWMEDVEAFVLNHEAWTDDGYSLSLLADDIEAEFGIQSEDDELWDFLEILFPERF